MATDDLATLGYLFADWVEAHCNVTAGVYRGQPFVMDGWQLRNAVEHYRVHPDATVDLERLNDPFVYRRSIIVGPQKSGKSPFGAALVLNEAVGPSLFDGFAGKDDGYACSDFGCSCGWEYQYLPGEAMGRVREHSRIGLMATAEDQVANVYDPLQSFVRNGPLEDQVKVREGFMRLPNEGRIDVMTAAAKSKLGKPLTFALGDETGLYTGSTLAAWETTRRGVAGSQGRTAELTNPWDPMENSAAQRAFESHAKDINRYYRKPPADLSYGNKADRHKIHTFVYAESPWVNVKDIDAEAAELVETDPVQAERFFGNRLVQGLGSFMPEALWDSTQKVIEVNPRTAICLGFDGSQTGDWTALRAETLDGHRFTPTYGPDARPTHWNPTLWPAGRIPLSEVHAAVSQMFADFDVKRLYCDPHMWESQIDEWADEFGDERVIKWFTNKASRMFPALTRYVEDSANGRTTHDDDPMARAHAMNARRVAKTLAGYADAYLLGKPSEHQKIDILMADVLAHEAAADVRAAGSVTDSYAYVF